MIFHVKLWRPAILIGLTCALGLGFALADSLNPGGRDSYGIFSKAFLFTPALATVAACTMSWVAADLRAQGMWQRLAARRVAERIAAGSAIFTSAVMLAVILAAALMMAMRGGWGAFDGWLIPSYALILATTSLWSIAAGMWLPRLPASIAGGFCCFFTLFMPQTLAVPWLRSLVGISAQATQYDSPDPRIYAGTALWALASAALAYAAIRCRLSSNETRHQLTRVVVAGAVAATVFATAAIYTVKELDYLPLYDRGLPLACSGGHPNWCVLEGNQSSLTHLKKFDAAIIATERETGMKWVDLSERGPAGHTATITENNKARLVAVDVDGDLNRTGERILQGILGTAYLCPNRPPYLQSSAVVTYQQWWKRHLYPKMGLPLEATPGGDALTDELMSWPASRQVAWLQSVINTNQECSNMPQLPLELK